MAKLRGEKERGSLTYSTVVQVALADPGLNGRQLRDVLSSDLLDGSAFISQSYAGHVKDAFVEVLKDLCRQQVHAQVAASPRTPSGHIRAPVVVTHVHDEASMRYKSYARVFTEPDVGGSVFSRGRYSKIQNNAISVRTSSSAAAFEWYSELQPLRCKDGSTIATALIEAVRGLFEACALGAKAQGSNSSVRVLHLLVGDGINTNENAAKRVLRYFLDHQETGYSNKSFISTSGNGWRQSRPLVDKEVLFFLWRRREVQNAVVEVFVPSIQSSCFGCHYWWDGGQPFGVVSALCQFVKVVYIFDADVFG